MNKILFYGTSDGRIADLEQSRKRYLSLVDGIIAGEGNGPESPDPLPAGLIIGGGSPVSVDCVAARLMGFDYRKIPSLDRAFKIQHLPLSDVRHEDIQISSRTVPEYCRPIEEIPKENSFTFEPHFGWKGHIELG